eukprot:1012827-Pleurochrysis_carterae.AAC.2
MRACVRECARVRLCVRVRVRAWASRLAPQSWSEPVSPRAALQLPTTPLLRAPCAPAESCERPNWRLRGRKARANTSWQGGGLHARVR